MESLTPIPPPAERRIAVRVKPAAEKALRQGHPWIFDRSIRRLSHQGGSGDLAVIFDARDRFLAIGLFDPESPIRIRVLQHQQPATIDRNWFRARLTAAFERRASLENTRTTGYRLLHGENDGVPGLVLDRYGENGVMRLDTAAWLPHLTPVLSTALDLVPFKRLILRLSRRVQGASGVLHGLRDGQLLLGSPPEGPVIFAENRLRFEADLLQGQKTGFFLDQRDNRSMLEKLIRQDSSLRKILNAFAYTGGFSVYAARAGAEHLTDVDASDGALAGAERNLRLNRDQWAVAGLGHVTLSGDAFAILEDLSRAGRRFDVVIVDPPSFANRNEQVHRAKSAYRRLANLSLSLLRARGLLVLSSCSSRIGANTYFDLVNGAAHDAGRPLQEIARTGHPLDHPIGFPEGAYLKCLFARA